jgi:hypothetical protein
LLLLITTLLLLLKLQVAGIHPDIKKMFGHLRRFSLQHTLAHALRPGEATAEGDQRRRAALHAARQEIIQFGSMAEKVGVLHTPCCVQQVHGMLLL